MWKNESGKPANQGGNNLKVHELRKILSGINGDYIVFIQGDDINEVNIDVDNGFVLLQSDNLEHRLYDYYDDNDDDEDGVKYYG
jgi:hypothetical protein